ncbi:helix-turn-helix transcriptional regulator [Priestia filamentosa]|uniref:helix-turn-helix transcriptional regulator n=1 Tax=Priestia filamentosa TaxID=1402861 RepID=UPI00397C6182
MSGRKRGKLGIWLDKKGIKQEWLAKETNLSRNTISDVCTGKRNPSTSTLKKLMKALKKLDKKAKVDDFFDF